MAETKCDVIVLLLNQLHMLAQLEVKYDKKMYEDQYVSTRQINLLTHLYNHVFFNFLASNHNETTSV